MNDTTPKQKLITTQSAYGTAVAAPAKAKAPAKPKTTSTTPAAQAPKADPEHLAKALRLLFRGTRDEEIVAFGRWWKNNYRYITYLDFLETVDEQALWLAGSNDMSTTIALNPINSDYKNATAGAKHTAAHVSRLRALFIDIDRTDNLKNAGPADADQLKMLEHAKNDMLETLTDLGFKSIMVTFSGNGFHLWVPIELAHTAANAKKLKDYIKLLEPTIKPYPQLALDTTVVGPRALLSLPGTINRKYPGAPSLRWCINIDQISEESIDAARQGNTELIETHLAEQAIAEPNLGTPKGTTSVTNGKNPRRTVEFQGWLDQWQADNQLDDQLLNHGYPREGTSTNGGRRYTRLGKKVEDGCSMIVSGEGASARVYCWSNADEYIPDSQPLCSYWVHLLLNSIVDKAGNILDLEAYNNFFYGIREKYGPKNEYHLIDDETDRGNAHRLLAQRAPDCRYIATWQKWLTWTGTHWEMDETQELQKWYKIAVDENLAAVVKWLAANKEHAPQKGKAPTDAEKTKEYTKYAIRAAYLKKSRNTSKMGAALTSAESENVTSHHNELNRLKDLLVVENGTVELSTATLRPSSREDMLTTAGVTAYKAAAPCPRWMKFLQQVFIQKDSAQADPELILFIQRLIGCAVTGRAPRENILPIFFGGGGNGKSVFLSTIREVLGDAIAYGADPGFLMEARATQHQTSLASIFGKRLILAVEPPKSSRLNTALVKSLSGGDQITCRRMREDEWTFTPECLIVLCTNELPKISETSEGIWRRVRLVEFLAKFDDTNKDPRLQETLLGEREGILNWIVEGAKDYLAHGLTAPARVMQATQQYRDSEDVVQGWIDECAILIDDSAVRIKASVLQENFAAYCDRNQIRSRPQDLATGLNRRGIAEVKNSCKWRVGIKIKDV